MSEDPIAIPVGLNHTEDPTGNSKDAHPLSPRATPPTSSTTGASLSSSPSSSSSSSSGAAAYNGSPAAHPSPPAPYLNRDSEVPSVAIWPVVPRKMRNGCWDPRGQLVFYVSYVILLLLINVLCAVETWQLNQEGDRGARIISTGFFLSSGVLLVSVGALILLYFILALLCDLASSWLCPSQRCSQKCGSCNNCNCKNCNCDNCSCEAMIFVLGLCLFIFAASCALLLIAVPAAAITMCYQATRRDLGSRGATNEGSSGRTTAVAAAANAATASEPLNVALLT
jgi:hypothetical protein